MSTPMEVATAGLRDARESLRRAEERLNNYLQGTITLPPGATYEDLKDEVTRCTAREERAQRNFDNALAAQNTILSPQSSNTSISCKSQSINGRCSTGRHTDRNKGMQKKFRKELVKRDTHCIATGETEGLVGAHIIPLNKSELIARDMLFSPRNGVLLRNDLEDDYDRHKWIFDYDGKVTVLYSSWGYKNSIRQVNISKNADTGPSKEFIELHNKMALEERQHHCPYCWKYVGAINVENHTAGSCEAIDNIGDANDDVEDLLFKND
jgi:hypothetical protein